MIRKIKAHNYWQRRIRTRLATLEPTTSRWKAIEHWILYRQGNSIANRVMDHLLVDVNIADLRAMHEYGQQPEIGGGQSSASIASPTFMSADEIMSSMKKFVADVAVTHPPVLPSHIPVLDWDYPVTLHEPRSIVKMTM